MDIIYFISPRTPFVVASYSTELAIVNKTTQDDLLSTMSTSANTFYDQNHRKLVSITHAFKAKICFYQYLPALRRDNFVSAHIRPPRF